MCCLDRRGGAAQQMRSVLSTLAQAGWQAHAVQMTLFDGKEEYPVSTLVGAKHAVAANQGKTFRLERDGVEHLLYYTASTRARTAEETKAFFERAKRAVDEVKPDLVLTYGSSRLMQQLVRYARSQGARVIFYLANPSYKDPALFELVDQVLVNSLFLQQLYADRLGLRSEVMRTLLPQTQVPDPEQTLAATAADQRDAGFITFVNPSLEKGATLFARLMLMAGRRRPEWTFLAVEGRMTDEQWRQTGLDIAYQPNVWWVPNQQDMWRIYQRTSVLLFPSFWDEAAGRVGAEAQLGGIPVLGSSHGGIPELLNGGGFCLEVPRQCREKYKRVPTEAEAESWFQQLERLMDDEAAFIEARDRALECGAWLHPQRVRENIIERFERYAEGEGLVPPMTLEARVHQTVVKDEEPGRNEPWPCGSGKKYKKCCLDGTNMRSAAEASSLGSVSSSSEAVFGSSPSEEVGSGASPAFPSQVRRVKLQERGREPLHVEIPEAEVFRIRNIFQQHEYALPDDYEPPETMTVVDVGANGGLFALYAQRWAERVAVHSFEPHPEVWELLQRNTAGQSDIYTHAVALAESDGTATLYLHPRNTGQTSMVEFHGGGGTSVSVKKRHAGAVLEELGVERVDVLKIDTEGAEPAILRGLAAYLPATSVVMLEYHSSIDRNWIEQWLQSDFVCTADTPQQPGSSVGTMKWLRRREWSRSQQVGGEGVS